jgi:putative membrane protein
MKKIAIATVLCFGLPLAAVAQTMGNTGTALNAQDKTLIQKAADGGLAEVSDGKLAQSRGNSSVQQIGMRMVTDHGKANDQLAAISQQLGDPAPTTTDATHRQMHAALAKLSGRSFDSQYLHDQLLGHEQTISLFKTEASSGSNPQLKNFASATLPTLEMHLSMIKSAMKSTNS